MSIEITAEEIDAQITEWHTQCPIVFTKFTEEELRGVAVRNIGLEKWGALQKELFGIKQIDTSDKRE